MCLFSLFCTPCLPVTIKPEVNITMHAAPFTIERIYNALIEKVWQAITDKDQMKQWYFDIAEFKPEVGFEFSFSGQGHKGDNYTHLCRVTEVVIEKKLAYTWIYAGFEGISEVCFDLFAEGEKTRLKLTHTGLEIFPAGNSDFAKERFAEGWTCLIGTGLKEFIEEI
jgi:uncharacterized protein YndB with AHSA1/START domain